MSACTTVRDVLPEYVCVDDSECINKDVLRTPAKSVTFPLNAEMKLALEHTQRKYDNEENMAGLAAPQIGYSYQIIIFAVNDDPVIRGLRPDLTDTMPRTVWLNPSYEGIGAKDSEDMEGCFSIKNHVGKVKRYKRIRFEALTVDGVQVTGEADGFLARVIQHEVDHVKGILCLDSLKEEEKIDKQEYIRMRQLKAKQIQEEMQLAAK